MGIENAHNESFQSGCIMIAHNESFQSGCIMKSFQSGCIMIYENAHQRAKFKTKHENADPASGDWTPALWRYL